MTQRRIIDVDITDRADGKVPVWSTAGGTHVYDDPVAGGGEAAAVQTADTPNAEAEIQYVTGTERMIVYDGQRNRDFGTRGWAAVALPAIFNPSGAFASSLSLPANGGSVAVQIVAPSHMLIQDCAVKSRDTSGARSWEWRLYEGYLNNGNSGENTVAEVAGANGSESFTASGVSTRVSNATSAPVYIGPGVYWLVVRNTHATNTFALAYTDQSTEFGAAVVQTKTLGSALGSTLDLVAATWTPQALMVRAHLDGRVNGKTTGGVGS